MKAKIILLMLLVAFLLSAGCIEEPAPSNNGGANDDTNGGNNNDNEGDDDQTITAGWYLKEIVDYGDPDTSSSASQYGITYARGDVTTNHYSADGKYELTVRTTWTAPPEYIAEEEEISIQVTKEVIILELLLLGYYDSTTISIDNYTIEPGFATSSKYIFTDATYGDTLSVGQGDTPDTIKTATFTGPAPKSDGPYDQQFGLIVIIANGPTYGIKYIYEWRE